MQVGAPGTGAPLLLPTRGPAHDEKDLLLSWPQTASLYAQLSKPTLMSPRGELDTACALPRGVTRWGKGASIQSLIPAGLGGGLGMGFPLHLLPWPVPPLAGSPLPSHCRCPPSCPARTQRSLRLLLWAPLHGSDRVFPLCCSGPRNWPAGHPLS